MRYISLPPYPPNLSTTYVYPSDVIFGVVIPLPSAYVVLYTMFSYILHISLSSDVQAKYVN